MKRLIYSATIESRTLGYLGRVYNLTEMLKEEIYCYITPAHQLDNKEFQKAFLEEFDINDIVIHHGNGDRGYNDISNLYLMTKTVHSKLHSGYRQYLDQMPDGVTSREDVVWEITSKYPSVKDWGRDLRYRRNLSVAEYKVSISNNIIWKLPRIIEPTPRMIKEANTFFHQVVSMVNRRIHKRLLAVGNIEYDVESDYVVFTCDAYKGLPIWVYFDRLVDGGERATDVRHEADQVIDRLKDVISI